MENIAFNISIRMETVFKVDCAVLGQGNQPPFRGKKLGGGAERFGRVLGKGWVGFDVLIFVSEGLLEKIILFIFYKEINTIEISVNFKLSKNKPKF